MGAFLPPVVATLLADIKQYSAKMTEADGQMAKFGATADASSARVNKAMNKAANFVIGAGLVVAATSVKMAMDFQTATTALVTGAGESEKNLGLIKKGILDMAGVVGQTPKQLAEGLYMIESAGYHGAEGLKVLQASAEGAAVGGAQMETVASALTTVMHDYNIPVSQANQVTSALIQTVASGKTHLELLGASLGKVIPTASLLGISFAQIGAAMAVQTNAGMSARLAAMHLNATMVSLVAPNKLAASTMQAFGLSAQKLKTTMADPKQGLNVALQMMVDAVGKKFPKGSAEYVAALKAMAGGTVGLQTILALTGTHAKEFATDAVNIGKSLHGAGKEVQGFALVQKDLGQQLKQLSASGSAFAIAFGEWLLPKVSSIATWGLGVINWFKDHPLVSKIASDAAIGVFVAAVGLKLAKAFQGIKAIFGGSTLTANTTSTTANTAALEANTVALGGKAAGVGGAGAAAAGGGVLGTLSRLGASPTTGAGVVLGTAALAELYSNAVAKQDKSTTLTAANAKSVLSKAGFGKEAIANVIASLAKNPKASASLTTGIGFSPSIDIMKNLPNNKYQDWRQTLGSSVSQGLNIVQPGQIKVTATVK